MITLRRNSSRHRVQRGKQDIRSTFHPRGEPGAGADGFGILAAFDEMRLPPGGTSLCPLFNGTEIITYVYRGALAQEDSAGNAGVMYAGEFQRMTIGGGIRYRESNALHGNFSQILRITLHPSEEGLGCDYNQKRFSTGERHNSLCTIASRDGRNKSLRILQDALICSSLLDSGHHIVHALSPGRSAWLHIIDGEATMMQNIILTEGDGAGITAEPSFSLTAIEKTELLLVDLGPMPGFHAPSVLP